MFLEIMGFVLRLFVYLFSYSEPSNLIFVECMGSSRNITLIALRTLEMITEWKFEKIAHYFSLKFKLPQLHYATIRAHKMLTAAPGRSHYSAGLKFLIQKLVNIFYGFIFIKNLIYVFLVLSP